MAIYNINSIQDKIDLLNSSYTDEYILQSLANLGQRLAIKGDSITKHSISFSELFYNENNNFDTDKYIGKIHKVKDSIIFSIVYKENLSHNPYISSSIPVLNKIINEKTISLTMPIDNVTEDIFYKNVVIRTNDYGYVFKGECFRQNSSEPSEILVCDFNKYTNKIDEAIRIVNYNNGSVLYHIKYNFAKNNYDLTVYYNPVNSLLGIVNNLFNTNITESNFTTNKIYIDLINNAAFNKITAKNSVNDAFCIDYTNDNFICDEISVINVLLKSGIVNVKSNIEQFNNDIKILYPFVCEYFSEKIYLEDTNNFKKQLFCELFNTICAHANNNINDNVNYIYLPINYTLDFYVNSNNIYNIYCSASDIIVKYINNNISSYNIDDYYSSNMILCYTEFNTRNILFNIDIEYSSVNDNKMIINNIVVNKKYSMPYINKQNMWVINDVETNINAKGLDAGTPNIIMVYNTSKSENNGYTILHGAHKQELLKDIIWKYKSTYVEPYEFKLDNGQILMTEDLIIAHCWIPDIQSIELSKRDNILELLRNSLIVSISTYNCLTIDSVDKINESYDENTLITTLWTLNESKQTPEFEVICDGNKQYGNNIHPALDLMKLTNINKYVDKRMESIELKEPDNYTHGWLVFDKSYITLKNTQPSNILSIYGTIANYKSDEIANNYGEYMNNLNLKIKYISSIAGAERNNITHLGVGTINNKYIDPKIYSDTDYVTITGTNLLYPNNTFEFTPNINIPLFNLSEVLTQDINILNRVNILSLSKVNGNENNSTVYYGYIGTSFDKEDKSVLHIGTSRKNINLGNDTLIDETKSSYFCEHNEISIDFNNIKLNGNAYTIGNLITNDIKVNGLTSNITHVKYDDSNTHYTNDLTITHVTVIPASQYLHYEGLESFGLQLNNTTLFTRQEDKKQISIIENQLINYYNFTLQMSYKDNKEQSLSEFEKLEETRIQYWVPLYLFLNSSNDNINYLDDINTFYDIDTDNGLDNLDESNVKTIKSKYVKKNNNIDLIYIGDALYIPSLLCKLKLYEWFPESHNKIVVNSNNKILYINVSSDNINDNSEDIKRNGYPMFMFTTNNFINDTIKYSSISTTTNKMGIINNSDNNQIYIGNDISVTYYKDNLNTLYITINECKNDNKFISPFNIKYEYSLHSSYILNINDIKNLNNKKHSMLDINNVLTNKNTIVKY